MKSCFARMFRGRRLDRNPLRRTGDRAETVIVIWLFAAFAAFAVVAPFAVRAAAGWTAPDGRRRTGVIEVPASAQRGTAERIWVTSDGVVTAPPIPAAEVAGLADRAAIGSILVLTCLLLIAARVIRHVFDRKRLAAWDAEWAITEPRWSGQR
jgi:hypothetical protein